MFKKTCLVLFFGLVGCSSGIDSQSEIESNAKKQISKAKEHKYKAPELKHVRYSEHFYVPELTDNDKQMPTWYFEPVTVNYASMSLAEIMQLNLMSRGVHVKYAPGVDTLRAVPISHKGSLGELINKLGSNFGYTFTADESSLTWKSVETAVFNINFFSGDTDFFFGDDQDKSMNTDSGSGTVTETGRFGKSKEYVNFKSEKVSIWQGIEKSIRLKMSKTGQISISDSLGQITVQDSPDNIKEIRSYINSVNELLTMQIAVDIEVIEFTSDKGRDIGIDWDAVKLDLASGGVFSFAGNVNESALSTNGTVPTMLSYKQDTGRYAGSKALISALKRQGTTQSTRFKTLISQNNQPVKVEVGNQFAYAAESGSQSIGTVNNGGNVGSENTLKLGVLNTGDSWQMVPKVADDKIMVQFSYFTSRKKGAPRIVESGGKKLEAPETDYNKTLLRFTARDGDTVLVSGGTNSLNEMSESSNILSILLGGATSGSSSKSEVIMLFTPRLVRLNK
jgi:type IVB pilus formation R64 PilN family outer membrane protein